MELSSVIIAYVAVAILLVLAVSAALLVRLFRRQRVDFSEEDVLNEISSFWIRFYQIAKGLELQKKGEIDRTKLIAILQDLEKKEMIESRIISEDIPLIMKKYRRIGELAVVKRQPVLSGSASD